MPPLAQPMALAPQPNFLPGLQAQINPMYMYPFMFNPMMVQNVMPQQAPLQTSTSGQGNQNMSTQNPALQPYMTGFPQLHPLGR